MKIEIFTKAWGVDKAAEDADDANISIYSLLKIDGRWITDVVAADVHTGNDFTRVTVTLAGAVTVTVLGEEDWDAATAEINKVRGR